MWTKKMVLQQVIGLIEMIVTITLLYYGYERGVQGVANIVTGWLILSAVLLAMVWWPTAGVEMVKARPASDLLAVFDATYYALITLYLVFYGSWFTAFCTLTCAIHVFVINELRKKFATDPKRYVDELLAGLKAEAERRNHA